MIKDILRSEGTGAALVLVLSGTVAAVATGRSRVPSLGTLSGLLSNPVPRRTEASGARPTSARAAASPSRAAA